MSPAASPRTSQSPRSVTLVAITIALLTTLALWWMDFSRPQMSVDFYVAVDTANACDRGSRRCAGGISHPRILAQRLFQLQAAALILPPLQTRGTSPRS
jgi:hypothetical protein